MTTTFREMACRFRQGRPVTCHLCPTFRERVCMHVQHLHLHQLTLTTVPKSTLEKVSFHTPSFRFRTHARTYVCVTGSSASVTQPQGGDNEYPDQNRLLSSSLISSQKSGEGPLLAKLMLLQVLDRRWHSDALLEVPRDQLIRKSLGLPNPTSSVISHRATFAFFQNI